MKTCLRIGTRDSQLAVWQATHVQQLLAQHNISSELVFIKSEGDKDLVTPLYEIGVQGIFTKALDIALLNNKIDIAVHSMKDVPTQPAKGIVQAAVLQRASYKDIMVYKGSKKDINDELGMINNEWLDNDKLKEHHQSLLDTNNSSFITYHSSFIIATSSTRRKAQWLHRYPHHSIDNLRGNVNTRLRKVDESDWSGAIFAAAGLERIDVRPENSIDLDWMLPAPAQGAIMVVTRTSEQSILDDCMPLHDDATALCVTQERNFLRRLMGGCTTPISALAIIKENVLFFNGSLLSKDGVHKISVEKKFSITESETAGIICADEILNNGGDSLLAQIK